MSRLNQCVELINKINSTNNTDALFSELVDAASHYNFSNVAIARHTRPDRNIHVPQIWHNYAKKWQGLMRTGDYALIETVMEAFFRKGNAIKWMDIGNLIPPSSPKWSIIQNSFSLGLYSGCSIIHYLPSLPVISVHFVVRNNAPLLDDQFLIAQNLGFATAAHMRRLWTNDLPSKKEKSDESLSPRQVECIKLVAQGKTSWEIARMLGISDLTVTEYLDDARKKLKLAKRVQLVLRAIDLGYFSLNDVLNPQ